MSECLRLALRSLILRSAPGKAVNVEMLTCVTNQIAVQGSFLKNLLECSV